MHILTSMCHRKGVLIKHTVRNSLFLVQWTRRDLDSSRAPSAELDKLVILRGCEEAHSVTFWGAQEQPIPRVCSDTHSHAGISGLGWTSGDTWSTFRAGPWIMLTLLLLVNTLLKDNVQLCNALTLNRNNLLYRTLLHASVLIASPPAGRMEIIKAGLSLLPFCCITETNIILSVLCCYQSSFRNQKMTVFLFYHYFLNSLMIQ